MVARLGDMYGQVQASAQRQQAREEENEYQASEGPSGWPLHVHSIHCQDFHATRRWQSGFHALTETETMAAHAQCLPCANLASAGEVCCLTLSHRETFRFAEPLEFFDSECVGSFSRVGLSVPVCSCWSFGPVLTASRVFVETPCIQFVTMRLYANTPFPPGP